MLARLFAVLLLLTATFASPLASAAPGPAPDILPQGPRNVYAELTFAQPNLTTLTLTGELWAYRYDIDGDAYDADDIAGAYHGANRFNKNTGDAFVADVERAVRSALQRTLAASFTDASVTGVRATLDRSSLVTPSGNPYDPPTHVTVTATIARTRAAAGLGDLSDAAVNAAFDAGARIAADLTLTTETGYQTVYAIGAPPGARWESGNGVSANGATLSVTLDNRVGNAPSAPVTGRLYDPTATPPAAEDIRSAIEVEMGDIVAGAAGIPVRVSVASDVRALDVSRRFAGALPPKVQLSFVNADGMRALKATGAIGDADVAKADDALLAEVRADVERAFGPDATVTGGLDDASLARAAGSPFGAEPPLRFSATASTVYVVPGADADDIDLALRVGGTAKVDLKLFAANGRETEYAIHPPGVGEFTKATGGTVAVNGLTANFVVPAGADAFPGTLHLRGRDVPVYDAADAEIQVLIDITDIDAGVGKALSGDLGTMLVDVTVVGSLKVIELPDEIKDSVPEKLDLKYVSSDAIRLLKERGYLSQENLTKLEESLGKQVREKLSAALGGEIPVESGLDDETLAASLISTPISSDEPVVFRATAKIAKPLAGGPPQTQGAIALYTTDLPLTLPSIQGLDTVYTVIAPKGLAITGVTGDGVETGKSADGRDQFTVRPSGESTMLTVSLAVTPAFVLAKFWPVVLLAVILLVLIIGTPVALVMRKRRKGAAKKQ